MNLSETIDQRSLRLPEQAAREALDFIEFLEQRYGMAEPSTVSAPAREMARQQALNHLAKLRIDWDGKPIPDRDVLYDDARAGVK